MLTLANFDKGAAPTDIVRLLPKHDYRADSGVVFALVGQVLRRPTEMNVDILREWWARAPTEDLLMVRWALEHMPTNIGCETAAALACRVPKDLVDPCPLLSTRESGDAGETVSGVVADPPIPDSNDPEALWLHTAVWALVRCVCHHAEIVEMNAQSGALRAMVGARFDLLVKAQVAAWVQDKNLVKGFVNATEELWRSWACNDAVALVSKTFMQQFMHAFSLVFPVIRTQQIKTTYPEMLWLRLVAGDTAVQDVAMRSEMLEVFAIANWRENLDFESVINDVRLLKLVCRTLVSLSAMSDNAKMWLVIPMSQVSSLVRYNYDWDEGEARVPLLFERGIISALSVDSETAREDSNTKAMLQACGAMTAVAVMERLAAAHPTRNVLECVFWSLTNVFAEMTIKGIPIPPTLRHQLGRVIGSEGHRAFVWDMWSLCTVEEYRAWCLVLGVSLEAGGCKPREVPHVLDSISQSKALRVVKMSAGDRSDGIAVETLLRHVATIGMTNPYTNEAITWEGIQNANPAWNLWWT